MENPQDIPQAASEIAAQIESQIEKKLTNTEPAKDGTESSPGNAGPAPERDADVVKDEEEAMRRAMLPNPSDEAPETRDPQVAEIESIINAFRH